MSKRLTTEEFIIKARQVHVDIYDYSKVKYTNNYSNVKIICSQHGTFEKLPKNHIKGQKCPKCVNESKILNNTTFIHKANLIHNFTYNYSKSNYIKSNQKIIIICPEHGEFWQRPNNHLSGKGCPECSKMSTKKFIEQSEKIHNSFYNYKFAQYLTYLSFITIICPVHGKFQQKPREHLNGCGCPNCHQSKGEKEIEQWLLRNNIPYETQKRFQDCCNKRPLPFDFYLPEHNTCIEFDGEQHFKPVKCWGGLKTFKQRQKLDKIKNQFCKTNNIKILRICFNENIQKQLFNYII